MEILQSQCFICGNVSCIEDNDHQKLTFYQVHNLLKDKAGYCSDILHLKFKIQKAFKKLKQKTPENLAFHESQLYLLLDKLHFWHLMGKEKSLNSI